MSKEEKELLLKDLSARLPYGVQCSCRWSHEAPNGTTGCVQELSTFLIDEIEIMDNPEYDCQICDVKPYLRPMSSMTDEEKKAFTKLKQMSVTVIIPNHATVFRPDYIVDLDDEGDGLNNLYDWLNANHFDYRGLIEKGLALEAPEDVYK